MLLKKYKRVLALTLAGVLAVSSMGVPPLSAEAGETTDAATGTWSKEYTTELASIDFNGGEDNYYTLSTEDASALSSNLAQAKAIEISMTFKYENGAGKPMTLFEISNKESNTDTTTGNQNTTYPNPAKKTMAVMINPAGKLFFHSGACVGSTLWQSDANISLTDGKYHTLTVSLHSGAFSYKIDGSNVSTLSNTDNRYPKEFLQAFFGETVTNFSASPGDWRSEVDTITLGGFYKESWFWHTNYSNFQGDIKSVTIKTSTEEYTDAALTASHRSGSASAMTELNALLSSVGNEADYNAAKWQSYTNSAAYTTASAMSAETNAPYEIYNAIPALETAIEKLQKPVDPNAQVFDLSAQTFNGSGYSLSEADVAAFKEKVKKAVQWKYP